MLATEYAHLTIKDGVPYIKGSRYKVIDIALNYLAYGWSPDEIHRQHPSLTKAQICSALAFYFDHQDEMDRQILQDEQEIQQYRKGAKQITRQELLARIKK